MTARLRVHATGPQCLVEDLGRPGYAGIGVGRSGAADRAALRLANRVLGNAEDAAALEVTYGGLDIEVCDEPVSVCVTGAPCPVTVDDRSIGAHAVVGVPVGARLRLGVPERGLRSYLAVRGGLDLPPVLGSRSRDVMGAVGPEPLAEGDLLTVGRPGSTYPLVDAVAPTRLPEPDETVLLRVVRGPRDAWVTDADALTDQEWVASDRSNRVGIRLEGTPLDVDEEADALPSEGAWRGAVQVPPGGLPVLFLADHPVTGGYPVVGVVVDADVDRAAQVRPGQPVRFRWIDAP